MNFSHAARTHATEQLDAPRAPAIVHRVLATQGEPLPRAAITATTERRGYDFSPVRVHTDEQAADSAAAVFARAYNVGSHIVLGRGARLTDEALLTHELTHVAQAGQLPVPDDLRIARTDDREEREAASGVGPITRATGVLLRRQVAPATDQDRRRYVEETIDFLHRSAEFYSDDAVPVDWALVSRVLDGWFRTVTAQQRVIDDLGGDPTVAQRLHTTYAAAVAALLGRAAAVLRLPLAEVYRRNRGRIPTWAWLEPHHRVPATATPVPVGREADPVTGRVDLRLPGISVSILPDAADPKLGNRARTRISLRWFVPRYGWESRGGHRVVTHVDPTARPTATIQTFYGARINAASPSGYGRGTTAEDVAGGAVDPLSKTVGFHEGQHGMDFVAFLQANPPPAFRGGVGMTVKQFKAESSQWDTAWRTYQNEAEAYSLAGTDCVGMSIDAFEQERAAGRDLDLVCPRP